MKANTNEALESGLKPVRSVKHLPTLRAILALILREMVSSYGRSPGGYIWAIAAPVAGIALLSFIFSLWLRSPPLGTNFALFYATGLLPFTTFTFVAAIVGSSINYSKALLAYPGVTFIDAILGRFILNFMTRLLSSFIIIAGILAIFEPRIVLDLSSLVKATTLLAILCLGVGVFNCFVGSMFPIYNEVWGIVTRPLFLLSGVLHLYDTTPHPFRDWLWYNPLVHIIGITRSGFYPGYDAAYASPAYVIGISLAAGLLGLLFLRRYYRYILFN